MVAFLWTDISDGSILTPRLEREGLTLSWFWLLREPLMSVFLLSDWLGASWLLPLSRLWLRTELLVSDLRSDDWPGGS